MNKDHAIRIYCTLIATTIKFARAVPQGMIPEAIEFITGEGDNAPLLPVGLQPYRENLELLRNILKLSEYMEKIEIEDQALFKNIIAEIGQMSEDEFIEYYKKRKQAK